VTDHAALTGVVGLIDESYRVVGGGHYLLAAALAPANRLDEIRVTARGVLPSSASHFRWAKEQASLRDKMIAVIESLELAGLVVVTTPVARRRQERARAQCLERLAWELIQRGTDGLLLESRGGQDAFDRRVLAVLSRRGVIPRAVTYSFGRKSDPALWIPDAIAGAVMAQRCEDSEMSASGLSKLSVIDISS